MRLEELATDDLRQTAAYCDTLLFTCGGMAWRPAHLPVGTSWFILRKLRDSLETALGGRIVSLPVLGADVPDDDGALAVVSADALRALLLRIIEQLRQYLTLRHIVLVTDSLHKEAALLEALRGDRAGIAPVSFVWWRDGMAGGEEAAPAGFLPAGEMETSLLLAIAKRLVDMEQKSVQRYGASAAAGERGEEYWRRLQDALRERVESAWRA